MAAKQESKQLTALSGGCCPRSWASFLCGIIHLGSNSLPHKKSLSNLWVTLWFVMSVIPKSYVFVQGAICHQTYVHTYSCFTQLTHPVHVGSICQSQTWSIILYNNIRMHLRSAALCQPDTHQLTLRLLKYMKSLYVPLKQVIGNKLWYMRLMCLPSSSSSAAELHAAGCACVNARERDTEV